MGESNHSRGSFEEEWRNVFEGTEMLPGEHVWSDLNADLAQQDAARYRSRAFYYKIVAAASILLALTFGFFTFFTPGGGDGSELAQNSSTAIPETPGIDNTPDSPSANSGITNLGTSEVEKQEGALAASSGISTGNLTTSSTGEADLISDVTPPVENTEGTSTNESDQLIAAVDEEETLKEEALAASAPALMAITEETPLQQGAVSPLEENALATIDFTQKSPPDVDYQFAETPFMYAVPLAYKMQQKEATNIGNRLWAGVDFGSGSFDPNFGSTGAVAEAATSTSPLLSAPSFGGDSEPLVREAIPEVEEDNSPGVSYTFGLNLGWRFGKRWLLQGGLQYGKYSSNTSTNVSIENTQTDESFAANPNSFSSQSLQEAALRGDLVINSSDVSFDRNLQFFSIPAKLGYFVLNRRFNILLNAGIASDFFLGSSLQDRNKEVNAVEFEPGEGPFRTVSFSGLAGIEFGYNFGRYALSLEPTVRKSIVSITSTDISSKPINLGVNFGFRYLFGKK